MTIDKPIQPNLGLSANSEAVRVFCTLSIPIHRRSDFLLVFRSKPTRLPQFPSMSLIFFMPRIGRYHSLARITMPTSSALRAPASSRAPPNSPITRSLGRFFIEKRGNPRRLESIAASVLLRKKPSAKPALGDHGNVELATWL